MAKDYAKRVFTTSRKPKRKRFRVELLAIPLVVVMSLVGYMMWPKSGTSIQSVENSWVARFKALLIHHESNKVKLAKIPSAPTNTEPDVQFDFYKELPNMRIESLKSDASDQVASAPKILDPEADRPNKTGAYILQLGLFKDATQASQLRLSLLLSGIEAEIVKFSLADNSLIYRVQRGPFVDQSEAKKLLRQFQKKGIECELKKL